MKTIVFLKEFAGRKKDSEWECDSVLARRLVNRKVAKFKTAKKKAASKE